MVLPQYLDRQVHQATRPDSPAQIGQHAWPVFGRNMLHRLDGQDRVEPGRIRQILQRCALNGECDAPRPGPRQHARRLVSARDPMAGGHTESEIMPLADTVAVQDVLGEIADQLGVRVIEGPAELP